MALLPLQSQTWNNLSRLLAYLPPQRNRQLVVVMLAAFFQGVMDIALVLSLIHI